MKQYFVSVLLLLSTLYVVGQTEDCVGAFPVCGNGDLSLRPNGVGRDDFANPNNVPPQCRFVESQAIWLRFKIKQAGSLGFILTPTDNTGADRDDYDFALYGPNQPCNNLGSAIRCSSTNPQQADVQAETGMIDEETDISEGPGSAGNGYIHWLDTTNVGDYYYLLIDNFDRDQGFSLSWIGTALLEDRISKEEGGVDLGEDRVICDGDTLELDATVNNGLVYTWNTGETSPVISIDTEGEYIVQVENITGCLSRDTINVQLENPPEITSINAILNQTCEPAELILEATGVGGSFEWLDENGNSIGTGERITLNDVNATNSGSYSAVLTSSLGCVDTESVSVDIYPSYLFETIVGQCPGGEFLVPETGEIITQTDTVEVNLLSQFGCDSIYVYDVQFQPCGVQDCIGFPSSFSPNSDGANDTFKPIFASACSPIEFKLTIYNRWGELVYNTDNSFVGWDGTMNGEKAQSGFYLWTMEYVFPDEPNQTYTSNGGVTLLR